MVNEFEHAKVEEQALALFEPDAQIVVLDNGPAGQEWTTFERMQEWGRALEAWLASRKSPKTRQAYRAAVEDFFSFYSGLPWDAIPNDVREWRADMETRDWVNERSGQSGTGLSAATVAQRMAGLSSFFTFTMKHHWVTLRDGRHRPLGDRNPVAAVDRPDVVAFANATCLSEEQACQLVSAIPGHTKTGLRDRALILAYLLTGRRSKEIRLLQWGDLRTQGGRKQYHWVGKGKERWDDLPPPVWEAMESYLRAVGRLDEMVDDAYIFTALSDRARRLPGVGKDWSQDNAISAREVRRIVKKYAKKAGLDAAEVHVHTLRHTAAELYRKSGDDIFAVSKLLAHSSPTVTKGYFDHMRGHQNVTWAKVAAGLQLKGDW